MLCPQCRFDIPASAKFSEDFVGGLQSRLEATDTAGAFGRPSRQSFETVAYAEFTGN
jgi:hypothetical protein